MTLDKHINIAVGGFTAASIAIAVLFDITHPKPTQETTITCTTNDSQIYADQGWKKIETIDYHRKSVLAGKGEIKIECKPGTLMCTAFINGKAYPETKGCAWYWRKV